MALAKTWKLVVTELGSSDALHEVVVEAANWMGALDAGRIHCGEPSGVPPGASCMVTEDHRVTLHDPVGRRTYVIVPRQPSSRPPPQARSATDSRRPRHKRTIAYDASILSNAGQTPSDRPKRPLKQTIGYTVNTLDSTSSRHSSVPPRSGLDDEVSEGTFWRRFVRTDRDPTQDNPLRYRERAYVVPPDTGPEDIEELLRQRFADLRDRMEDLPAGKFVNLAVFDHEWTTRPSYPPLATLQWKDWREVPEVSFGPKPTADGSSPPAANGCLQATPLPPGPSSHPPPVAPSSQSAPPSGPTPASLPPAPSSHPPSRSSHPPSHSSHPPSRSSQATASEQLFRPRRAPATDEHDARLAHAFEAAQDLLFLQTPLEGMEFVIRLLTELIPTESASGCLYDIDTDELRFVVVTGIGSEDRQGVAIPCRSGLMGVATTYEGFALRIDQITADSRFNEAIDGREGVSAQNALYFALSHQGRLLGVIQLLNRKNRSTFTESDANLLSYVGRQTAAFLHKARIAPPTGSGT